MPAVEAELAELEARAQAAEGSLGAAEARAKKADEQYLRLTADFDNYRKRAVRPSCVSIPFLTVQENSSGLRLFSCVCLSPDIAPQVHWSGYAGRQMKGTRWPTGSKAMW